MSYQRLLIVALIAALLWISRSASGGDLKVSLPQRSKLTPVQRLNREGVDAVRKHHYDRAKTLFYRAYLFDPDDPFTLNNLGYIAELEGNTESAQRFYSLALARASDAIIDKASDSQAQGKSVQSVLGGAQDLTQLSNANREAVRLLSKGRASEAQAALQRNQASSPADAFTLNNLGVAKEMQGDLEGASKSYGEAASAPHSTEQTSVTSEPSWRGKLVSEMAMANAGKVQKRLQAENSEHSRAARLNLLGVSALNRNDRSDARQYFQQAFALDQDYSFSLNNLGYLAELDGDLETAQDYYERARTAERREARVGLATSSSAEGAKLSTVAQDNDQQVDAKIAAKRALRIRDKVPIQLKQRDKKPGSPEPLKPAPDASAPPNSGDGAPPK